MLPDPMTTRQLMEYADRLQLDASQRLAIESIHDEYKNEFRTLRDGEIADFLEETRSWQGMDGMPQREVMESFINKMERLQASIKKLDDGLFDRLVPVLSEEQLPMLARVRLARERQRYSAQQMMSMTGRKPVDLSEVFFATDLPPDVLADIDPAIAQYERRLTSAMRQMSKAAGGMYLDMFDAFEELGYGGMSEEELADPEVMTRVMEDMQRIWSELGARMTEMAAKIAELNRKTYRRVAALLPQEVARGFRNRYYSQAYPELGFILAMERHERFRRVMKREDLSDEQREALTAAIDVYRQQLDRVADDAVKLIEAQRESSSPFDFDPETMQDHQQKLLEVQAKARELMMSTMSAIREIVGEETMAGRVEDAQQKALALAGIDALMAAQTDQDTNGEGQAEDAGDRDGQFARRIDPLIPGPISRREIARYARDLDLDDGKRSVLEELHADYVQQFNAIDAIVELPEANQSLWSYDPTAGTVQPATVEAIERVDQLRRKAIEEITRLDHEFFDDVQSIVSDEHEQTIARLQMRRLRQTYNSNAAGAYSSGPDQSVEASIDLVELVENRRLDNDHVQRIDSILARYEESATDLFRQRFEAQLDFQRAFQKWWGESQALQGDPAAMMEYAQRYQEIMGDASEKLGEAGRRVATLNRQMIDELIAALPEEAGRSIRRAYDRKAFPSIYNDPVSVDRHLTEALKLEELTEKQREQLDGLAAAYRPEYERLCQAMVANVDRDGMNPMNFEPVDWQDYQQREEQRQKLRFDRDELSYRAINRLKAVLSPEQIERIGGLPEPKEGETSIETSISWQKIF